MRRSRLGQLLIVSVVAIVSIFIISYNVSLAMLDIDYNVTITEKEVKRGSEGEDKYLVFAETKDGEIIVFENTDNFLRGKYDSTTVQAKLKVGNTYKLTVVGRRVPALSMYQNIIKVEEIK